MNYYLSMSFSIWATACLLSATLVMDFSTCDHLVLAARELKYCPVTPAPPVAVTLCLGCLGGGGDQTLNILCQPLGTKQATRPASLLRAPRGDNGEFQMKDLLDTRLTRVVLATNLLVLAAAV